MALANVPHLDVQQALQETLAALGPGISYSRLLRLRTGPPDEIPQPSLLLECEICESWQMSDPLTYRFQIRKGIRWHDISPVDGRELTADDIVFSYERQRTPGYPNASFLQNVDTIDAEGRYNLVITLKPGPPDPDFLVSLADGHNKVVAREVVEQAGDLRQEPVIGSGPWIWRATREAVGSVFERNPDYFEDGLPFLDELVISVIRDETSRLAAFVTGEVDVYRITPGAWDRLNRSGKSFDSFLSKQGGTGLLLTMNVSAPPFDNLQVRRAVFKAMDPWNYVDTIWAGQGYVSLGMPVQRASWLLARDEMRERYFADPSGARDILSGSGLATPIKFDLLVAQFGDIYLEQGRRIEEDLRSVGFDPDLRVVTPSQYAETVWRDKAYQMSIGVSPPLLNSTNAFLLAVLFGASARGNVTVHADERLDSMVLEQAVETDPVKRGEMIRKIQRYLLDHAYLISPATGSVGTGARWVFDSSFRGFYPNTRRL